MTQRRVRTLLLVCFFLVAASPPLMRSQTATQVVPETSYAEMRWRCIGPHRGGRVVAVSGVAGKPEVFYFGSVGGGVWKTIDAGRTWKPIFDKQPISSIGAIAVSRSNPDVIYVGSGEADMRSDISYGNGVYKSTDAGTTWSHIGLDDTRQIGRIIIDPKNPDRVFVAALGHGFGPNEERGVFRSTDGGRTWVKILYKDENTGAIDLAFDPDNSQTLYATLWNTRRPAWSVYAPITGPGGGLYKSTDGGTTWIQLTGHGLPTGKIGRTGIDVAPGTSGKRIYALIDAEKESGLYLSEDAGENWSLISSDPRIFGRGWYFGEVRVDPKNPNTVYVSNVSLYRSVDGGKTFIAFRGAPGGDDYHSLWIDPQNSERMIAGVDQGTIVSVNGGVTWSSWYNQPTAQFYHVVTDNQFPYYVYGAQQDSGTAAVASRSDYGQITFRDWYPIGAGESGSIVPDPVDPQIVFGGSTSGETYRFDKRTGQVQDVSPTPAVLGNTVTHRYPWTTPLVFQPQPPHALYQASQFLFVTKDRGHSWKIISPDLTLRANEKEEDAKGVIYSIAPSPLASGTIWAGTDNSLIHLTRDEGRTWSDVSPPALPEWSMVSAIEAGHFEVGTAYAAIDRHQMDDLQPYIFRTHDLGKTWSSVVNGIPNNAYVHVVREDPIRKGLLFAGTELGVYVSFDDGDHWQSLQLNLPVTSIRDLAIKDNDLVAATHGRSFWILDDFSPLRELNSRTADGAAFLFHPAVAYRLRKNEAHDTPLPPETPAGKNPPAGAIIDYLISAEPAGDVTLEILDNTGTLVRRFSSTDPPGKLDNTQSFPTYWFQPSTPLSKQRGMHRFVWDLRYPRPLSSRYGYSIAAVYGEDAIMLPEGPLVLPGEYQVRLTIAGQTYSSVLEIREDPRVQLGVGALEKQLTFEKDVIAAMEQTYNSIAELRLLRKQLQELQTRSASSANLKPVAELAAALDLKAQRLIGGAPSFPPTREATLSAISGALAGVLIGVDSSDTEPALPFSEAFETYRQLLATKLVEVAQVKEKDLVQLNLLLRENKLPAIELH